MLPPPMKVMLMSSLPDAIVGSSRRHRGCVARAPKIAVPTRTSVAPSAIAASRSADMPIDSVSTARPAARHARRSTRASARNCARCRATSSVGSAMPMRPRSASRGSARDRLRERAGRRPGATPLFDASPLMLTWTQTSSGGRSAGRARDEPLARSSARSIVCTQAKRSAATRALLLCSGPIRCHSMPARSASRVHLGQRLPARSSRRTRAARARATARTASAGNVLLTASSAHRRRDRGRPRAPRGRCAPSRLATPSRSGS